MAACGIVWFRLLVIGRRCPHRFPLSSSVKCLLSSKTTRALEHCWVPEACTVLRCLRLCTQASQQQDRHDPLCSLLGFGNDSEYRAWRREHEQLLSSVPERRMLAVCQWLLDRRIDPSSLRDWSTLLRVSTTTLKRRLAVVEREAESTELSVEAKLTLLTYKESLLSFVSQKWGVCATLKDRVRVLCEALSLSEKEGLLLFAKLPCLLSHEPGRLERMLSFLEECGLSRDALLKDPWVFRHSEALMTSRAERCRALGVPVRTWLLRCPEDVLERHLQLWRASRRALGTHPDTPEYLVDRLHCTHLEELVRRHPRLLSIRPPKLKEVLDLLFSSGYSTEQVCQSPRVLSSSVSKLRRRLQWLAARHAPLPSLYTLGLPEKAFERAFRKLIDDHHYHPEREPLPSPPPQDQAEPE
ncbi:mitochondrial transcription termination factor [Amblyomma americanum]